jgi:uncharacterized protein
MQNVVVDSGPLLALFDRHDAHHELVVRTLEANPQYLLHTTWPVLTETAALLSSRVGKETEIEFLEWVIAGALTVDSLDNPDLDRMVGLVRKYRDLPFDFADASVAALAARLSIDRILSLDSDFDVYRTGSGRSLRNLLPVQGARRRKPSR